MLSTHIMQEVEALCDRIMIINHGKIVATDSPSNIKGLASPLSQIILVEFAEAVNPDLFRKITEITRLEARSGTSWLISGGESDLRPLIFKFAVENGLTILTLKREESSLESIFLEITK